MTKAPSSPLTPSAIVEEIASIPTQLIVSAYSKIFQIDVNRFLSGKPRLSLYRCSKTGLEFFDGVAAGDGDYYAELAKLSWYYADWRWEFSVVKENCSPSDRLLDVGCGNGRFLKYVAPHVKSVAGLELNKVAADQAVAEGFDVKAVLIEEFARENLDTFDSVSSFHVAEHVEAPSSLFEGCVSVLRPGGKLFLSVPNNGNCYLGPIIFFNPEHPLWIHQMETTLLNLPPHHMLRWSTEPLRRLTELYPLKLLHLAYEPIPPFRKKLAMHSFAFNLRKKLGLGVRQGAASFYDGPTGLLQQCAALRHGDAILAIYEKL